MDDTNTHLQDEIRTVVERQLQRSDLQEANNAVDRIADQGHSREKAKVVCGYFYFKRPSNSGASSYGRA